jgi:hypothetical protein
MTEPGDGAGRLLWPVLLLGVAADLLFRTDGLGLNLSLWLAGAVWAWWNFRRRSGERLEESERMVLLAILAVGVGTLWRENQMLRFLDGLALVASFAILPVVAAPAGVKSFWELSVGRLLLAAVHLARRALIGLMPTIFDASRSTRERRTGFAPALASVVRGTVLSVPALLIFGGLLGHADPVFGNFLEGLVRFDVERLANHALVIFAASWAAAALLGGVLVEERLTLASEPALSPGGLGRVEIGMILGLLNLLFAAFIAFQLPYFFGGAGWVERSAGITLAEYARKGFFELVVVSALVLPLLLLLHARLREEEQRGGRLYRSLAAWQVALVLVIMASAIHRMTLYQHEFGLTEDRFFASAFMGGLAVTFGWFGATVLRGRAERFVGGALVAWAGWLLLLHAVNPERVIVQTNLARAESRRSLDISYLVGLSSDATPTLVAELGRVPALQRPAVITALRTGAEAPAGDWRAWHYGRAEAHRSVAALEQALNHAQE